MCCCNEFSKLLKCFSKGIFLFQTSPPLHLALFWQTSKVKIQRIIRSAVVPMPLPPRHVQAFQCMADVVTFNSPLTRLTISVVCSYNAL